MDLQNLKSDVEDYVLDLPSATSALITKWINQAIDAAVSRHNFRFMEEEVEQTTTEDTRLLVAKPARWKEGRLLPWMLRQDGSSKEIDWVPSASDAIRLYGSAAPAEGNTTPIDAGPPKAILETEDELHVFPFPDAESDWDDGNYRLRVPYWRKPADLAQNTDTNWITDNMAFYVIFQATAHGMMFNRDEQRAGAFFQLAEVEFKKGQKEDKMSRIPDRMTIGVTRDVYGTRRTRRY